MAIKNRSKYAILGILNIAPGSGYDIKKYCDTVIANIWNENYGHIYPMLKSLEEDGLIVPIQPSESERKNKFTITEKGRMELVDWLKEETLPQPVRSEFMLKFLFSSTLPKEQVVPMLTNYRDSQKTKLAETQKMMEALDHGIREISPDRELYLRATLRRAVLSLESTIQWCDETIEQFICS